jgi:phosphatidylserine decarboxylase
MAAIVGWTISMTSRMRGTTELPCHVGLGKGEEMGWFEHGSTIIMLAPPGVTPMAAVRERAKLRLGQPLMQLERPR